MNSIFPSFFQLFGLLSHSHLPPVRPCGQPYWASFGGTLRWETLHQATIWGWCSHGISFFHMSKTTSTTVGSRFCDHRHLLMSFFMSTNPTTERGGFWRTRGGARLCTADRKSSRCLSKLTKIRKHMSHKLCVSLTMTKTDRTKFVTFDMVQPHQELQTCRSRCASPPGLVA